MRKWGTILALAVLVATVTSPSGAAVSEGIPAAAAYLLQQAINAAMVGAFYGLLATAYALLYGLTGRIVLSFGDSASFAAYAGIIAMIVVVEVAQLGPAAALVIAAAASVGCAAALGMATQSLAFAPLFARRSQAMLVASIGVAIVIQEVLRLASGGREQWLQPMLTQPIRLAGSGNFTVQITAMQAIILVATLALAFSLVAVMRWSGFGRLWRACAQDPGLAALCGVNVPAVIATTFMVASGYAGFTGLTIAVYYGGVSFYMGLVLGLKALFAAIIGGFGSIGGALAGAALLAAVETMWSAYFAIEYRDVAVFLLFVAVLIFRPQGLVAVASRRD